ncbi:LOW QUALITY PROTEIN: neurofilament heavy polypeptide [Aegotheles albertisi]
MSLMLETLLGPPGGLRKDPARAPPRSAASSGFHSWLTPAVGRARGGGGGSAAASSTESLDSVNGEPRARNEKELLQVLNDRFAGYIERVRALEQQNRALAAEAAALRQQQAGRSAMGELYARELRDMRGTVLRLGAEKGQLRLERARLAEDVAAPGRLEEEARQRAELEAAARGLAQLSAQERARGPLEERARALREEAELLRRQHRDEVGSLLRGARPEAPAEPPAARPGVTAALRDLRAQLEGTAVRSTQQAEEWFRGNPRASPRPRTRFGRCRVLVPVPARVLVPPSVPVPARPLPRMRMAGARSSGRQGAPLPLPHSSPRPLPLSGVRVTQSQRLPLPLLHHGARRLAAAPRVPPGGGGPRRARGQWGVGGGGRGPQRRGLRGAMALPPR